VRRARIRFRFGGRFGCLLGGSGCFFVVGRDVFSFLF
jgi:hypothetical protein